MKKRLPMVELAQLTYQGLKKQGIDVTLSGGACVSIYTENEYQSQDLDFIREIHVSITEVAEVMAALGFRREGRHFTHPHSDFYVEFPPPPLTVGKERPSKVVEKVLRTGKGSIGVKMLSPTDCIKDRLCQFFYWKDRQALDQAVLVALRNRPDVGEIERWAANEGMQTKCREFLQALEKARKA